LVLTAKRQRLSVSVAPIDLFRGFLQRPHRGAHLAIISLAPAEPSLSHKIAATDRVHEFGIVDPRRHGALFDKGARCLQQPPAGCHDHSVARREMLEQMIGHRSHALGDRQVLLMDAGDAGEIAAGLLCLAIDQDRTAYMSSGSSTPGGTAPSLTRARAAFNNRRRVAMIIRSLGARCSNI